MVAACLRLLHSEGIHRTKLDDLLELYWDHMDEQEQPYQDEEQEQDQEVVPVG